MYPGITVNCSLKKNKTMMVLHILNVLLLIVYSFVYSLLGITICDKLGISYDANDFLDLLIDSIFIAFWPITLMIYFLLDD